MPTTSAQIIYYTFSLGGVTLTRFEVPEEFEIGFEKHLAVHKTLSPQGQSKIDTHLLGVFPVPTSWRGTLYGSDALTRYQQIERLSTQAADVIFQYGPLKYTVQVGKVVGRPRSPIEINYEIEIINKVAFTSNGSITSPYIPYDVSTQTFVTNGATAWTNLVTSATLPPSLVAANTTMNTAIQNASPLRTASYPVLFALANTVNLFNTAMYKYLAVQEQAQLDAAGNTNLLYALQVYSNYSQFYNSLQTLIGGELGNQQIVAEANTNLFAIARQFYPNLSTSDGADLIAQVNQLADYFITTRTMLTIPSLTT